MSDPISIRGSLCAGTHAIPYRGFSLIELMIAMTIGLLVIAGVGSVFVGTQQTYRTNNALSDVQEGSRIAFEMLARDIRMAGLSGCNNTNGRVANVLNGGSTNWFADWTNALHGYDDATTDPVLTTPGIDFSKGGTPVAKSSVHVLSTGAISATISMIPSGSAANLHMNEPSTDLQLGDVIIACNYDHATILQITDYSGNDIVVHNTGNKVQPGNCTKNLSFPANCVDTPPFPPFIAPGNIAKLTAHVWYIGTNSVGSQSLYLLNGINSGSGITLTPQEMVRNVTNMQILYNQPPNAPAGTFTNAASVTNWAVVDAAQVQLTVKSTAKFVGTTANQIERTYTSTTTVRNRVL